MKTDDDKALNPAQADEPPKPRNGRRKKDERDQIRGLVFGVIIILLGVLLILDQQGYLFESVWAYFLFGVGVIFLIEAVLRSFLPQYYRPIGGKIFWAIVFMLIGGGQLYDLEFWWPAILIVAGAALVAAALIHPSERKKGERAERE